MKAGKSSIALVGILVMFSIWGFIVVQRLGYVPAGIEIFIFLLILIAGVYAFIQGMKKQKDIDSGFPVEDELSDQIKYRAGYQTFIASMYIWIAMFLFQGWFKDHDTLFGIGVLLPAVIFIGIRGYLGRNYHEDTH